MPTPLSLMALWRRNRSQCRGVGAILDDTREGKLPGVTPAVEGFGFTVTDENAALVAMRKAAA